MIDEFTAQFEALKGHVHTADTPARAVACILAVCEEAQATCLATAQLPQAIETALRDAVATTSLDLLTQPYAAKDLPLSIDKAQVGVTGIVHAIAETGTLVEVTTNDATRLVSSLPRTHIGVFHERDFIHGLRESASTFAKFSLKTTRIVSSAFYLDLAAQAILRCASPWAFMVLKLPTP